MYQLVNTILEPYSLLLVSLLGVQVATWRQQRPRHWIQAVALGITSLLCVVSLPAISFLAVSSLERLYPPSQEIPSPTDAIIVLAANASLADEHDAKIRLGDETVYRCWHAFQLYRQAGACRIIVCGGKIPGVQTDQTMAESMRQFFVTAGVPSSDVVLEDKSTTTYENARNSLPLLRDFEPQRVFLVTSATHMRRADYCFRRLGIMVLPAPCNHHATRLDGRLSDLIPSAGGLIGLQAATHEWLGLLWYWFCGRV